MIIYGASGHGKVVASILKRELKLFFDDNSELLHFLDREVVVYNRSLHPHEKIVIAIGNNKIRKKVAEKIVHSFGNVIAKSSEVDKLVEIGLGSQIIHASLIQAGTKIGNHVIVNSSASIDHDCRIADYTHIAPNSTLCGNVIVGEGSLIGAGAVILPGVTIGSWCVVGAGSVVTRDVNDYCTVVGNPAKLIIQENAR